MSVRSERRMATKVHRRGRPLLPTRTHTACRRRLALERLTLLGDTTSRSSDAAVTRRARLGTVLVRCLLVVLLLGLATPCPPMALAGVDCNDDVSCGLSEHCGDDCLCVDDAGPAEGKGASDL